MLDENDMNVAYNFAKATVCKAIYIGSIISKESAQNMDSEIMETLDSSFKRFKDCSKRLEEYSIEIDDFEKAKNISDDFEIISHDYKIVKSSLISKLSREKTLN